MHFFLAHYADHAGAQPQGGGRIAQAHRRHADVHLREILAAVPLSHAGLETGLFLADQDESGDFVPPGAAGETIVHQGVHHFGLGLVLIHHNEMPGLGVAGAGGEPGGVHQPGEQLAGDRLGRKGPAALPLPLQCFKIHKIAPFRPLLL